jgi:CMP-N-acetylneuraminic acid synthetase
MVARQLLPKVYRFNGAFFQTHADILIQHGTFMPRERSINLDSMMDLFLLEALLEKKVVKLEEYEI